ncbi:MAG: SH3-like domain-containing protein [Chloroflexi bacterium]|nr:SH3-like domain-containing protein [Chloroflexota bacterium]
MDSQLFELATLFQNECRYVVSVEHLPTKVRFGLRGGFVFDLFYRAKTGNYSYVLIKNDGRVIGWNNAPHYDELETHPHHFHAEDGSVSASEIGAHPHSDIVLVARRVNEFLATRV